MRSPVLPPLAALANKSAIYAKELRRIDECLPPGNHRRLFWKHAKVWLQLLQPRRSWRLFHSCVRTEHSARLFATSGKTTDKRQLPSCPKLFPRLSLFIPTTHVGNLTMFVLRLLLSAHMASFRRLSPPYLRIFEIVGCGGCVQVSQDVRLKAFVSVASMPGACHGMSVGACSGFLEGLFTPRVCL